METIESWKGFLEEVLASEQKHYLWLRSLSYLEYIGYRKMVKSLDYHRVNRGVYHHLTDEIRHSFLLKELAWKCFPERDGEEAFDQELKKIAENYFQAVDRKVEECVKETTGSENPYLCYMLVSYVIEKRAMKVYPAYYARLQEVPSKLVIQKIITDERDHLSYLEDFMETLPQFSDFRLTSILDFENFLFSTYLKNFQGCVPPGNIEL